MYLDRFGPGLRAVGRLALVLLCAYVVHVVVVLVTGLREAWHHHDQAVADLAALTDTEVGDAAPWATAARPLDDVRSALDLFERNYREAVERPALRWGEPSRFGDGSPSVEFVEQVDLPQWRGDRRRRSGPPL